MSKKPIFVAGPCVIESPELLCQVAEELVRLNKKYGTEIIFKASFDKANRTSINSFRGPGLKKGLAMLGDIKQKYGLKNLGIYFIFSTFAKVIKVSYIETLHV